MPDILALDLTMPERSGAPEMMVRVELERHSADDRRPVIFLLPGGPGSDHMLYKKNSRELAEHFQLIYFDPRGTGQSDKHFPEAHTMENYIADVEEVRSQLQARFGDAFARVTPLGASAGGMIAVAYAVQYTEHLDKLILVATAASHHFQETAEQNIKRIADEAQYQAKQDMFAGKFVDEQHATRSFVTLAPLYSRVVRDKMKETAGQDSYYNFRPGTFGWQLCNNAFPGWMAQFDCLDQLVKLAKVPTLILAGEHDWVCDVVHSQAIYERIPSATFKVYQGAYHSIPVDVHDEYIQDVVAFMYDKPVPGAQCRSSAPQLGGV